MANLSLNLGPKLDSGIETGVAEMVSVVWLMRVEETSRSNSTLGPDGEMRVAEADAEDVALVVAGHGNEDATVSGPPRKSEKGEKGVSRPGERDRAGSLC